MVCTISAGTASGYYLSEQARYYTGGKEAIGRWYAPSASLGLSDGAEIDDPVFERLHSGLGRVPRSGVGASGRPRSAWGAYLAAGRTVVTGNSSWCRLTARLGGWPPPYSATSGNALIASLWSLKNRFPPRASALSSRTGPLSGRLSIDQKCQERDCG